MRDDSLGRTMNTKFDELTKSSARSQVLGAALKKFHLRLAGAALVSFGLGTAAGATDMFSDANWSNMNDGMDDTVLALAASGGDVYAGGRFETADVSDVYCIARWNGSSWSALGAGMDINRTFGARPVVHAIAVSDSEVYAAGEFSKAGDTPARNVAKWNGSEWSPLGSGLYHTAIAANWVRALAVSGSDLYAGGNFTMAGGSPAMGIARWDGTNWSALGSGMNQYGSVFALAVSGSNVYAGGNFTSAGGSPANRIAKWNGNSWSPLGSGMDDTVTSLVVSDNDLYAGGSFTVAGGSPAHRIAKWNGTSWSPLGLGMDGAVAALAVSGGSVYAAGDFTRATNSNGMAVTVYKLAKWDGSSWSALGSGMDDAVSALVVSVTNLYAGGNFSMAGGKSSWYTARAVLGDAPGYNRLTSTLLSGGEMQFSYVGYPTTNYALDRTFNLSPPITWVGQQTNSMTISGVLLFTNTPAPGTNNYWRIRSVP